MPIDNLSLSKRNDNSIVIGKIQSYIRKNALDHERMQRLKKFQSLEKSFNIKRISIKRPLQFYKVKTTKSSNDNNGLSVTVREPQNPMSTIESLKNKIKSLEKDDISDADLEIRLNYLKRKSQEPAPIDTEKQVRDMIQNYRKVRNRASQFRSQKILQIIQIKKTVGSDKQKPKVKSLQLANRTSKDFMKNVYLKFINGQQQKGPSGVKDFDKKNMSLTAKKFYEQRKTHYRSKTQTFWKECEEDQRREVRANRVKLFKATHNLEE